MMSTHTIPDKGAEAERAFDSQVLAVLNAARAALPNLVNEIDMVKAALGRYGAKMFLDGLAEGERTARRAPAPAPVADGLPPLPEMMGAADLGCVLETPDDWDAGYRETWKKLQIADCNRRQWRAYALQLRDLLAADRQARTSVPAAGAVQQPVAVGVKTWQERMTEAGGIGWTPHSFMAEEIADLRAQLSRQSQGNGLYAQEFLNWNRSQKSPPVAIGKELAVARKAVELAGAAPAPGNTAQPVASYQRGLEDAAAIAREYSDEAADAISTQAGMAMQPVAQPGLKCPSCGGEADNGHDREIPPNPYYCKKCNSEPAQPVEQVGERLDDDDILEAMYPHMLKADGGYACDIAPKHVIAGVRAVLELASKGATDGAEGE